MKIKIRFKTFKNNNMEKKHLIGKKVRGFRFEGDAGSEAIKQEGEIGTIDEIFDCTALVKFGDNRYGYPLDQIEQHLVKDELPSQYEVGMSVYDYTYGGKGVIEFISDSSPNFPLSVQFEFHNKLYTSDGKPHVFSLHPSLSLTPYDPINGGATFPTFKTKLPEIEQGALVYVKTGFKWEMRFFSHFDESANIYCFINQEKSGKAESWHEYSLTNPLIEEK